MTESGAIPGLSDLYAGCIGSTQYKILRPFLGTVLPAAHRVYQMPPPNPSPRVSRLKTAIDTFFMGSAPRPSSLPAGPARDEIRAFARDSSFRNRSPQAR